MTEFSQETAASDSDDDSSHSVMIVVQILVNLFTSTGYFLPHQLSKTIRHCGITYGTSKAGQGNNKSWKGPGQSEDRIQSHRQSHQILF